MSAGDDKAPRELQVLALLGLIGIGGGAVGCIGYSVLVNDGSTDALTTIAAVSVGAIAGVLGATVAKPKNDREPPG